MVYYTPHPLAVGKVMVLDTVSLLLKTSKIAVITASHVCNIHIYKTINALAKYGYNSLECTTNIQVVQSKSVMSVFMVLP